MVITMNSVFSAFKSSNKNNSDNTGNSKQKSLNNKKLSIQDNSYENLRHIREIGSSSKMSTFVDDDDGGGSVNTLGKRCPTPAQPIQTSFTLVDEGHDVVDFVNGSVDNIESPTEDHLDGHIRKIKSLTNGVGNSYDGDFNSISNTSHNKKLSLVKTSSDNSNINNVSSTMNTTTDKLNSFSSDTNNLVTNSCSNFNSNNNFGSSRLNRPRLSLSGIGNNNNNSNINTNCSNSLPLVHGRPSAGGTTSGGNSNEQKKTRLSTHQRNLSLDFRSMGILLPPVSQVTNTRINLTQHHRNRSLDSALQRIPEVEVSSPNAESENTLCTSSILGATMCSKIAASSTNPKNTPINQTNGTCKRNGGGLLLNNVDTNSDSEIVCSKDIINDSKKREDLTSLGSDDSGIICGSEPDQASLTRIRRSHESLDSAEIDPEEECIEIETQSMDEEYRMLQSDLCFDDLDDMMINDKLRYRDQNICKFRTLMEQNGNKKVIQAESEDSEEEEENDEQETPTDCDLPTTIQSQLSTSDDNCKIITPIEISSTANSKKETIENMKNDVIFRGFFGATKNAIFRTAQSIIDNHEKKNAKDVKSPTEFSKKKEFFTLKSNSSKNKGNNNNNNNNNNQNILTPIILTPETVTTTPELEVKILLSSTSSSSLNNKDKTKLPGIAQCLFREQPKEPLTKTLSSSSTVSSIMADKGSPSGLLRFFESPIFNIHFAIHYLFYSKEPGVLSFIGNKIFNFPNIEVDLYIPQLILMYIQMDELAEVLDPYLVYRCRKSVDFSLKCTWLLEAYNYNMDEFYLSNTSKKIQLSLMKDLYPKKERKQLKNSTTEFQNSEMLSPFKKTHHRSQSDATGLLNDFRKFATSNSLTLSTKLYQLPIRLCLGDLTTGRSFDNGCLCFESVRGTVNDLLGHKTLCHCGAPKLAPQKEFMKALIDIGKTLTSLPNKSEKNSRLRVLLNLINKNLPARVWLPLYSEIPHHIVRITEEKTAVLNSKDKTPYIIYVEVVEVNDIFSSPVITKLMPTLRHTKSEEHLELNNTTPSSTSPPTTTDNQLIQQTSKSNTLPSTTKKSDNLTNPPLSKTRSSNNLINNEIVVRISKASESYNDLNRDLHELGMTEDDVWSQEDDEITAQYLNLHKMTERDAISQMSLDSCDSREQHHQIHFNIGDVRLRHCAQLTTEYTKPFSNDPEDPSAAALKEPWDEKEKQIRNSSPYGHLSNWRLLSAIVKCGDDLRQELMATQLLQMFKIIWEEENVDLWVRPYKIVCLSSDSGLIEPILNTVSLHQIKKNSNKSLKDYFIDEYGSPEEDNFKRAQKNFLQSCAAYCLISYLLQVKDRHNGNILLHSDGHLIHIDFGFILNISPKNLGFEQSPFKLTPEFVEIMGGPSSELLIEFRHLLLKGLMAARKHMDRVINIVEIMRSSSQLPCFKNGCSGTVSNLRKRFHMNLTENELERKVDQLVLDSLNSLSTKLYDGYQYFTNGIL